MLMRSVSIGIVPGSLRPKTRCLHGRDGMRQDDKNNSVRLLRTHYKHNQIFTDHDIPLDAIEINFEIQRISWEGLIELLDKY